MGSKKKIIIMRGASRKPDVDADTEVLTIQELRRIVVGMQFHRYAFRYASAEMHVANLNFITGPVLSTLAVRFLTWGRCEFVDMHGAKRSINIMLPIRYALKYVRDLAARGKFLRGVHAEVASMAAANRETFSYDPAGSPLYIRADLWFGVLAGGSVGHIAGVVNNLHKFGGAPIMMTSDLIPTVHPRIPAHVVAPEDRFLSMQELPQLNYNKRFIAAAREVVRGKKISLVYQRYGLNNYSGLSMARELRVPFVLEYNGSEVWISKNWGPGGLDYESLSIEIEDLNLRSADLVVVVSKPMADELLKRGVAGAKILVNPNGVDPDTYSPETDGGRVRKRYDFGDRTVFGFIGTFGPWHGAEVLVEAYGKLVARDPSLRDRTRLLLIGDGARMPEVRACVEKNRLGESCVLTGLVPQTEGPEHLAACDILVSPHVPNPDGTPFFGSPTKLFEYMATGRGIVASDLDQIGEVLKHKHTAWMVKPGDVGDLERGMTALLNDVTLRESLGRAARAEVIEKYTWEAHTGRILRALKAANP